MTRRAISETDSGTAIDAPYHPRSDAGGVAPDVDCTPVTCTPPGGTYCGIIGNGCGGTLDCGPCAAPEECGAIVAGLCGVPGCVANVTSCAPTGGIYCGTIGDGCGRSIDCGSACAAPGTCGGTGVSNLCGKPGCTPASCNFAGGKYCGAVGDGLRTRARLRDLHGRLGVRRRQPHMRPRGLRAGDGLRELGRHLLRRHWQWLRRLSELR